MPKQKPIHLDGWKSGLENMALSPDTRVFIDAVYDMPLDFVAAFEADRDRIAGALLKGGIVKGLETAQAYATELLGRLVWTKVVKPVDGDEIFIRERHQRIVVGSADGQRQAG